MEKNTGIINEYIKSLATYTIIEAGKLYQEKFSEIPATTFHKAIERLTKSGELVHLAKGMYYRPKESRYGQVPLSDEYIAGYFMEDGQGIYVGYKLYNEKGLTTQVGKNLDVLSEIVTGEKKNAQNVRVEKSNVALNEKTIPVIETLEILQNYGKIEDINKKRLTKYMEKYAKQYSEKAVDEVLAARKYKKSTIAFLKAFLDYLNVKNTLEKHLSKLSVYNIPSVEELYEK